MRASRGLTIRVRAADSCLGMPTMESEGIVAELARRVAKNSASARAARRRAPCEILGRRRRRGVPRLLSQWREAVTRLAQIQT